MSYYPTVHILTVPEKRAIKVIILGAVLTYGVVMGELYYLSRLWRKG